jgi:hypothetical protein
VADRNALGVIGYLLCGITAAVMLIGATVVSANLSDPAKTMTSDQYGISLSAKSR